MIILDIPVVSTVVAEEVIESVAAWVVVWAIVADWYTIDGDYIILYIH